LTACERKITRVEVTEGPQTCFACHSDQNTFLVAAEQQWEHSKHASGETLNENDSSCKNCHTSEGFVARAGTCTAFTVTDNVPVENPTAIHCFTCHAPHTDGDFRLRWTCSTTLMNGATYDLKEGNLCASCHQARRDVTTYITASTTLSSRWGPHHSPQGDLLIGSNGYEYAGYVYEQTNHRSATANGCIDCHMSPASQPFVGGHSWNMEYDEGGSTILNTAACADCHGEIDDFNEVTLNGSSVQDSVDVLITALRTRLENANLVNASGSNAGLPKAVTTSADSAGAVWNYLIAQEDRSHGVHNPKYILGLLSSSIDFMDGSLPAPPIPLARASARPQR
jgi:formate-dependent nitrite reductase cytochrome c552 subunit